MERITKKQVESKVEYLNKVYDLNLNIGYAYGKAKIESNNGSMDISCRGTKTEIYWQLVAIEGVLRIKNNYYTQDSYQQVKPLMNVIEDLKKKGIQNTSKLFEDIQEDLFTNDDMTRELIKDHVKTYDVDDCTDWIETQGKSIADYK